eukprot:EG_transcript_12399
MDPAVLEEQIAEGHLRLQRMEEHRLQAEKEGRWVEAQEWNDRMRDFNLRHARRVEQAARLATMTERHELLAKQQAEVQALVYTWNEKMAEFEAQAKDLVEFGRKKHLEVENVKVQEMRKQVFSKKVIPSKMAISLRLHIDQLLKQRKYLEAEQLRAELLAIDQDDERRFLEELSQQAAKKERIIRSAKDLEMNALLQRIRSGREELKLQRKLDLERLLQAHQNALNQFDQRCRLHHSRRNVWISRQAQAMQGSPSKSAMPVFPVPDRADFSPVATPHPHDGYGSPRSPRLKVR